MVLAILKALHIMGVIIWMGVLLYMPRLFIYQTEANSKLEPERSTLINQYKIMSKNLWIKVGWPMMIVATIFGLGIMHPYFSAPWFWIKMGFVVLLIAYHHLIHLTNKNLQKDKYAKSLRQLKLMNQGGIIFLVVIVILAVLKSSLVFW